MRGAELQGDALLVLVYRQMCTLCGGNHPDLDDLAQTAVEQVLRSHFEGRSKFSTFTFGICYRVWLKHLRFFRRFRRYFEFGGAEQESNEHSLLELTREELRHRVHRTLDKISPKQRAVILLHDIGGLEVEEVAEIVQSNVLTVRSRLRDGRRALARKFELDPYFGDEAFRRRK